MKKHDIDLVIRFLKATGLCVPPEERDLRKEWESMVRLFSLGEYGCGAKDFVWSNGDYIICTTEEIAIRIAEYLAKYAGSPVAHLGWFDPEEDERFGEVDEYTGCYYVTI